MNPNRQESKPDHRSYRPAFLVAICAGLLAFALAPALASAAHTRIEVNSFGSLDNPTGVAIDQETGDVYVADTANHRIEKFSESGAFLLAFGKDVGGSGVDTCTSSCRPGTAGSSPGAFEGSFETSNGNNEPVAEERLFLAVDNDPSSPSHQDVYVGDPGDRLVSKFDENGNLITAWGNNGPGELPNGQLAGPPSESFGSIAGLDVEASGDLAVLEGSADFQQPQQFYRFTEGGGFLTSFPPSFFGALPVGLAVDPAGQIYMAQSGGVLEKLSASGTKIGNLSPGGFRPPVTAAFALSATGDLYVATAELQIPGGGQEPRRGVDHYAFNGSGEVVEPDGSGCAPNVEGCQPTDTVGLPFAPSGVDVSSASGDVYLADSAGGRIAVYEEVPIPDVTAEAATGVTGSEATLNGTVGTAGSEARTALTGCRFEYLSLAKQEEDEAEGKGAFAGASEAQCEPAFGSIPNDGAPHPVTAHLAGLAAGATYRYRLVAENQNAPDTSNVETLETAPPPAVEAEATTEITSSAATLGAKVNPEGSATSCEIEWGPATEPFYEAPYARTEPCEPGSLGSGASPDPVTLRLAGLTANTTYHWRLIAQNANGTTVSPDHTFVYLTEALAEPEAPCANEALRDQNGSAGLPDCRAYEMVSPTRKNGSLIGAVSFLGGSPDVAADGERVIAPVIQCFASSRSCNAQHGNGIGSPYQFSRSDAGWATTPLAPPATEFAANTPWAWNASTGTALFSMPSAAFGENDFYLRDPRGAFEEIGPITPPAMGPQEKERQGGRLAGNGEVNTAGFSHRAWEAKQLHWPAPIDETRENHSSVYEYAGTGNSRPLLVGVSGGYEGGENHSLISTCGTYLGNKSTKPAGTMSADGRTVFFSAEKCAGGSGVNAGAPVPARTIYARIDGELPSAETVAISDPRPSECGGGPAPAELSCREAPPAGALFEGASADGQKALFATTRQLTDEASEDGAPGDEAANEGGCTATTGPNGCNLYLYDFQQPPGDRLIDLSAGDSSGKGPRVQGVLAISPDGSHVFFVARGVLSGANAEGNAPKSGAENLYAYERDAAHPAGRLAFVARLAAADAGEWNQIPGMPANVTPDGRFLVFVSHARLTPDDTSRSGAAQVFRYDAQGEGLLRLSIGRRGFNDNGNRSTANLCNQSGFCAEDARIVQSSGFSRSDPTMSGDAARVFFISPVALVPGALDDRLIRGSGAESFYAENLYEWEQQGHGGCDLRAGCVSLVSSGKDVSVNNGGGALCTLSSICLLGASETGRDVFFTTTDPLVPADTDTELDVYDARIGGGFPPPPPPQICEGAEACHGAGTVAGPASQPSTNTFSGAEEGPKRKRKTSKHRHHKKHHHHKKKRNHKKRHGRKKAAAHRNRGGRK